MGPSSPNSSALLTARSAATHAITFDCADACLVQRIHHFAVDVELVLLVGRVADANGFRVVVTLQPRNFPLPQEALAREAVHDLHLRRTSSGGAEQPVP